MAKEPWASRAEEFRLKLALECWEENVPEMDVEGAPAKFPTRSNKHFCCQIPIGSLMDPQWLASMNPSGVWNLSPYWIRYGYCNYMSHMRTRLVSMVRSKVQRCVKPVISRDSTEKMSWPETCAPNWVPTLTGLNHVLGSTCFKPIWDDPQLSLPAFFGERHLSEPPRGAGLYTAIALELGDLPRAKSAMEPLKHQDLRLAFQSLGGYWVPKNVGKWTITDYLALFIMCYYLYLSKYILKTYKEKSCWVWLLLKKYNPAVAGWSRVQNDATCPVEIGQPRC